MVWLCSRFRVHSLVITKSIQMHQGDMAVVSGSSLGDSNSHGQNISCSSKSLQKNYYLLYWPVWCGENCGGVDVSWFIVTIKLL